MLALRHDNAAERHHKAMKANLSNPKVAGYHKVARDAHEVTARAIRARLIKSPQAGELHTRASLLHDHASQLALGTSAKYLHQAEAGLHKALATTEEIQLVPSPVSLEEHRGNPIDYEKFKPATFDKKSKKWMIGNAPAPRHMPFLSPKFATDVKVSTDPRYRIHAVFRDLKGRMQVRRNPNFAAKQSEGKHERVSGLIADLPRIHKANEEIAYNPQHPHREAALATALSMHTGIRPGGYRDTGAEKKAYGATTLQARHIHSGKDGSAVLRFPSKSGQTSEHTVEKGKLASELLKRAKSKGPRENVFNTTNDEVQAHVSRLTSGKYHPKDLRTARGTMAAQDKIKGMPVPKTQKEFDKAQGEVAKHVSGVLQNTPKVALAHYIHDAVFHPWRKGIK